MRLTFAEIDAALRSGDDTKVLSYLYAELLPKVRKHVIRNGGSKEEAEDIFQDAILILYRNIMEGRSERIENVPAFLFQMTKNLWINRAKVTARVSDIGPDKLNKVSDHTNIIQEIVSREKQEALAALFSKLGEKCIQIMELHLYEKKSMEEIAVQMNLEGANAAKAQHYRCKQKLIELANEHTHLKRVLKND